MKFASGRIEQEFSGQAGPGFSARTRALLEEADIFCTGYLGWDFTVTSILRTPEENDALYGGHGTHTTGVHVAGRGADIRTRDVTPQRARLLTDLLNFRWVYDPMRPWMKVAVLEDGITAGSGPHLHCQSHPQTTLRP